MVRRVLGALKWAGQTLFEKSIMVNYLGLLSVENSHTGDRIEFKF